MSIEVVQEVVAEIGVEYGADVFFISAGMSRATSRALHREWTSSHRRDKCVLVLTTYGGDPNAAYVMARFLRRVYSHVTVIVVGYCKSAGTLLALGANELAMGVHGELGPLDIQTPKDDDLMRPASGLDIIQAVNNLIEYSRLSFDAHFLNLLRTGEGTITTKTAADIACRLTDGVIGPIASQVDPIKLGEESRAVRIAVDYGLRLGIPHRAIDRLTGNYPSHGFVIDLEEAQSFLDNVRAPNELELMLEAGLAEIDVGLYYEDAEPIIKCIGGKDQTQGDLFDGGDQPAAGANGAAEADATVGGDPANIESAAEGSGSVQHGN